jgi:hypothetical protein
VQIEIVVKEKICGERANGIDELQQQHIIEKLLVGRDFQNPMDFIGYRN